jgi:hypothetical protein
VGGRVKTSRKERDKGVLLCREGATSERDEESNTMQAWLANELPGITRGSEETKPKRLQWREVMERGKGKEGDGGCVEIGRLELQPQEVGARLKEIAANSTNPSPMMLHQVASMVRIQMSVCSSMTSFRTLQWPFDTSLGHLVSVSCCSLLHGINGMTMPVK